MNKISQPYLEDILNSIIYIEKYWTEISSRDDFEQNTEKQDAVIRRLEIIGEATKRLEDNFKKEHSSIPWRKMAGMRDVLIHDYDELDIDLIWQVVVKDLPVLKKSIELLLSKS